MTSPIKTTATRLTHDHKADDPVEIARIEEAGGFVLRSRVLGILAVARAIGDHAMKEFVVGRPFTSIVDVFNHADDESNNVETKTFVCVACDGLWDVMTDEEVTDFIAQAGKEDEKISRKLIDEAMKRGSSDNISVVVAWF